MARLSEQQLSQELQGLSGWQQAGNEIRKTFQFDNFVRAIAFVNRVADAAEAANHHPDIDIRYNKVAIALTTHDEGGISDKDVALAQRLNGLEA
ncbi:MAG TPA: 4a-hydroxytetrahydrobiopterin dehydratase [Dehalococcoidia bacterium]|jgi:4a-hydroxytetrahydrobiopterin dehydratase